MVDQGVLALFATTTAEARSRTSAAGIWTFLLLWKLCVFNISKAPDLRRTIVKRDSLDLPPVYFLYKFIYSTCNLSNFSRVRLGAIPKILLVQPTPYRTYCSSIRSILFFSPYCSQKIEQILQKDEGEFYNRSPIVYVRSTKVLPKSDKTPNF